MKGSQKLLLVGGLALAIWGMAFGLWYAVFAEHQALDNIGRWLTESFLRAAHGDSWGAKDALQYYRTERHDYARIVDVHGHWIGLAMVLIVLAFAFDRVRFGERARYWLAFALLLGAITFPLGVLLQTVVYGAEPKVIAVAGSALVIGSLAGVAVGLWRGRTAG